jgi:hypothetical protein
MKQPKDPKKPKAEPKKETTAEVLARLAIENKGKRTLRIPKLYGS